MQLKCPHCSRTLDISGEPPSFCAYCGHRFSHGRQVSTVDYQGEPATLPPTDTPAPEAVSFPETIGGYRLLRQLGRGGMGTVHEAEEIASGRRVAVKLITRQFGASFSTVERFRQEGRLASRITHPRCVFVLAADEEAGQPYIVMELMPGLTLQELVEKKGPLSTEQAIARILDVIEGLEEAHRNGVIHRDVKPSNCFVEADGRVKIGDFGLSKSLMQAASLTRTGSFLGTPLYASPEQVRAERVDEQSDVYSVAATLFFLLTGRAPHQTSDAAATLARIVADPAPSMRSFRPDLPSALDDVVLRGLERDRSDRWRNLSQLRDALLPFVSGRLSIGGMSMRFAALLIDALVLGVVTAVVVFFTIWFTGNRGLRLWLPSAVNLLLAVTYFGVLEGRWGLSLGKLLFRLRVREATGGQPPGWLRGVVRAGVFFTFLNLESFVTIPLLLIHKPVTAADYQALFGHQPAVWWMLTLFPPAGLAIGSVLLFLPARARNGYRGVHDFLSGTRVIGLPPPARRPLNIPPSVPPGAPLPAGTPEQLGPYRLDDVLRWSAAAKVVRGEDSALGRKVWIWLRPADAPALSEARRQVDRLARLRYLASGASDECSWESFVAPAGSSLPDWIAREGRLAWPDARPLLEELTDELAQAIDEGTLPISLTPGQVWVEPNGRVKLLDMPFQVDTQSAKQPEDQERALALLAEVAILMLEGRARTADSKPNRVESPAPLHVSEVLQPLFAGPRRFRDVRAFHEALLATRDKPQEVTRQRRVLSMAALAVCVVPFLFMMFVMTPASELFFHVLIAQHATMGPIAQTRLREGMSRELAAAIAQPNPLARAGAYQQFQADQQLSERLQAVVERTRSEVQARETLLHPMARPAAPFHEAGLGMGGETEEEYQKHLVAFREFAAEETDYRTSPAWLESNKSSAPVFALILLALPLLWTVWVFIFRGGLILRYSGFSLVNRRGQRASRFRCAWRTLVTWLPVALLLMASLELERRYWSQWQPGDSRAWTPWAFWGAWWAALALVLSYAVLALWFPSRGPHDRLAGTYVVPR